MALATAMWRPSGARAIAQACRPVRISRCTSPEARSITETDPSSATLRASARARVPRPAVCVRESATGRRPPQLETHARPSVTITS
ncbi:MAG: hypothetical protein U1F77_18995 [Kiritimatiellia bacterium]